MLFQVQRAVRFLDACLAEARAEGFLQAALERHGVQDDVRLAEAGEAAGTQA